MDTEQGSSENQGLSSGKQAVRSVTEVTALAAQEIAVRL
jgi:hypothetical protein